MTPNVTLNAILQRVNHVQEFEQKENARASQAKHFYRSFCSFVQAISHNMVTLHRFQQNTAQNEANIKLTVALLASKIIPRTCVWKHLFTYIAKSENPASVLTLTLLNGLNSCSSGKDFERNTLILHYKTNMKSIWSPLGMLIVNQVTFLETQYIFAKWKQNISYGFTIRVLKAKCRRSWGFLCNISLLNYMSWRLKKSV